MKNLFLTTVLTLMVGAVFSQAYKPMNGYYQYNGNLRFNDSLFLDTTAFASGLMTNDTTGSYLTGYGRLKASSGVGVANRLAYWSSPSDITSNAAFSIIPDSGTLSLSPAGEEAITILGSKKIMLNGNSISSLNDLEIESRAAYDIKLSPYGDYTTRYTNNMVEFGTDSNVNVLINADSDTAMFVSRTGNGFVGIRTNPVSPLHIQGGVAGTEVLVRLENAAILTPNVTSLSLNNGPAGVSGDPSVWLQIYINGTLVIIPAWTAP